MPRQDLGVFAKRQLESVRDRTYEKDLEPLSGYDYFPQRNDAAEEAQYYIIKQYDRIGYSRWFGEVSGDFPRADAVIDEDQFPLHTHVVAYGYTRDEMLRSQKHGTDLENKRSAAALRAIRQRNNYVMCYGDQAVGLFGAFNYPGTPRVYLNNPIAAGTDADTIVQEIASVIDTPNEVTRNNTEIDYLGLPTDLYNHIRKRRMEAGTDTTVLSYLRDVIYGDEGDQERNSNVMFVKMPELSGAGPNGEDLLFGWHDSEETWGHTLARPFTQEDAIMPNSLCWEIQCHSKTGGISADFPLRNVIGVVPDA